jgi:hypothetical protein
MTSRRCQASNVPGVRIRCGRRLEGSTRQSPGDHGTVSPVQPRTADLPPQDRDLMPDHQDLRILSGIAPRQEHEPPEHPDHQQISKTDEHERRA